MDLFVAPMLPQSDRPNAVMDFVGVPLMMALLDLFHLPHGPRIRDRASHGEAVASELSFAVPVDAVLWLYCALMIRARWHHGRSQLRQPPLCGVLGDVFAGYVSVCHVKTRAAAHLARFQRYLAHVHDTMTQLHAHCGDEAASRHGPPHLLSCDPPAFGPPLLDSPLRRALAAGHAAALPAHWRDDEHRETVCDVFGVCRIGRHVIPDGALAALVAATACGPEWIAFDADALTAPQQLGCTALTVIDTGPSSDNLTHRVGGIAKCCAAALASLHVQILSALRDPRDLKTAYRTVDSVVLVARVYLIIGRICVERFHAVELWDRRAERSAELPLLVESEKLLTAVLSLAQRLHKAIVEDRTPVAVLLDRVAPVVARAHALYAKRRSI